MMKHRYQSEETLKNLKHFYLFEVEKNVNKHNTNNISLQKNKETII